MPNIQNNTKSLQKKNTFDVLLFVIQSIFLFTLVGIVASCGDPQPPLDTPRDSQPGDTTYDEEEDAVKAPNADVPHRVALDDDQICSAQDESCETEACCDGFFCSTEINIYGEAVCIPPMEDGNYCWTDAQCQND